MKIPKEPKFLCVVKNFPNIFVPIAKLGFEGSILSLFYGTKIDCCSFGGFRSMFYICSSIANWA
jgi:hypothetical protein